MQQRGVARLDDGQTAAARRLGLAKADDVLLLADTPAQLPAATRAIGAGVESFRLYAELLSIHLAVEGAEGRGTMVVQQRPHVAAYSERLVAAVDTVEGGGIKTVGGQEGGPLQGEPERDVGRTLGIKTLHTTENLLAEVSVYPVVSYQRLHQHAQQRAVDGWRRQTVAAEHPPVGIGTCLA